MTRDLVGKVFYDMRNQGLIASPLDLATELEINDDAKEILSDLLVSDRRE